MGVRVNTAQIKDEIFPALRAVDESGNLNLQIDFYSDDLYVVDENRSTPNRKALLFSREEMNNWPPRPGEFRRRMMEFMGTGKITPRFEEVGEEN